MARTSRILDQFGQPLVLRELNEPQTQRSQLGFLSSTFEGHPSRGLTPDRLARILVAAEQGDLVQQSELMEDMEEKDGHVFAEMGKRRRALLAVPWRIEPPPGADAAAIRAAELVNDLVQEMPSISDIVLDMGAAIGHGYANLELEWHLVEGKRVPAKVTLQPATWFMTAPSARDRLLLRNETGQGEALRPFGWIQHVAKAKPGYVTRAGLARVLAWPYLFKNYSVRDLAEFLEIYGLPMRLGKYPNGASEAEKMTLLQAVVGIGHNAAGIIPEGMTIDFQNASEGRSDPFEAMVAMCEKTQSKTILGQTLTSQADGKSSTNALGNIHNEVRLDLRDGDLMQVAATLTRDLLYPLAALNVPGITSMRHSPRFVFDTSEPEDVGVFAEAIPSLVDYGMEIPLEYAHKRLGIPRPEKGQAVLKRSTSAPPPSFEALRQQLPAVAAASAVLPTPQVAIDVAVQGLQPAQQQQQIEAMLAPLMARINAGESLEALQDELSDLYPTLDDSALQDFLARLYFVAEVWGRLNAG